MTVYIVYCSMEDDEAARVIADAFGYEMLYIPVISVDLNDPRVVGNDVVLVGGWLANPFVVKYFPEYRYDKLYNADNFPDNPEMYRMAGGFGISADGKRATWAKSKDGTMVTTVFGMAKEDTLEAAKRFSKPTVTPLVPVGVCAVAIGGAVYAMRGR